MALQQASQLCVPFLSLRAQQELARMELACMDADGSGSMQEALYERATDGGHSLVIMGSSPLLPCNRLFPSSPFRCTQQHEQLLSRMDADGSGSL